MMMDNDATKIPSLEGHMELDPDPGDLRRTEGQKDRLLSLTQSLLEIEGFCRQEGRIL
jgi:hypothetical protein